MCILKVEADGFRIKGDSSEFLFRTSGTVQNYGNSKANERR